MDVIVSLFTLTLAICGFASCGRFIKLALRVTGKLFDWLERLLTGWMG